MAAEALKQEVSVSVIEDVDKSEELGAQIDLEEALKEADSPAPDNPKVQQILERIDRRDIKNREEVAAEGDDWAELRELLPHGDWEKAIRDRGKDPETVRDYIRYGEAFRSAKELGKSRTFLGIPQTRIYAVKAPSAPKDALETLLEKVEAGNKPTDDLIRTILGKPPREPHTDLENAVAALRRLNTTYQNCHGEERDEVCRAAWEECELFCLAVVKSKPTAKGKSSTG